MADSGKLILRLALGVLILLHGIAKLSSGIAKNSAASQKPAMRVTPLFKQKMNWPQSVW